MILQYNIDMYMNRINMNYQQNKTIIYMNNRNICASVNSIDIFNNIHRTRIRFENMLIYNDMFNVFDVIGSFGLYDDKQIIKNIVYDDNIKMINIVRQLLNYERKDIIIKDKILPHVTGKRINKAYYLCYMIYRLLSVLLSNNYIQYLLERDFVLEK